MTMRILQSIGHGGEPNGTHPMPMLVQAWNHNKMRSVQYYTKSNSASVRLYLKPGEVFVAETPVFTCWPSDQNISFASIYVLTRLTHWQSQTTDSPPTKKDNICLAVRRASLAGSSLLAAWNLLYSPTFRPLFPTWWDAKNIMKIANGTDNNGGGQTIPDKQCWWQQ